MTKPPTLSAEDLGRIWDALDERLNSLADQLRYSQDPTDLHDLTQAQEATAKLQHKVGQLIDAARQPWKPCSPNSACDAH